MPRQAAAASSEFRIFETDEFLKRLRKFPRRESDFLQRKLRDYMYPQLRKNPFLGPNIRKLKGYTPDTWRYRVGDVRVFFQVDQPNRIVFMLSIDDRRGRIPISKTNVPRCGHRILARVSHRYSERHAFGKRNVVFLE